MGFLFENLDVYKMSVIFSCKVNQFCKSSLKREYFLSDQLKRAALSVSLNIAEGSGRWHKREKRNFYVISRGSAFECLPILQICHQQGLISDTLFFEFKEYIERMSQMLTKLIKLQDN